jgi:hypothetical protein
MIGYVGHYTSTRRFGNLQAGGHAHGS